MPDDVAVKIQLAADMIYDEMNKLGSPITYCASLHLARRLWDIWHDRHEIRDIQPGEVARRFRERYEQ